MSGLQPGDRVIVEGIQSAKPGAKVALYSVNSDLGKAYTDEFKKQAALFGFEIVGSELKVVCFGALIGIVPGASGTVMPEPKNLMAGMSTRYARTPPAHMIDAIRGPMI